MKQDSTPATLPSQTARIRITQFRRRVIRHGLLAFCFPLLTLSAADLPNIVVIMADDMGYGDVHALNHHSRIPTPHLDRLAAEGMTFTDAHTPSAVCTPTRYGLLTGRYCWRSSLKRGVLNGYGRPLIEADRPTFASFLKSHGYHTGIVGKWHLGLNFVRKTAAPENGKNGQKKKTKKRSGSPQLDFTRPVTDGPNRRGFDYSYIIPASLDFPPYVYVHNQSITDAHTLLQPAVKFPRFLRRGPRARDLVMADCLDHLKDRAIAYLESRATDTETPFLLYFPLTAPHKPVLPHPRFRGKSKLGPYGDFILQVDQTVGAVLQSLARTGLSKNTLVIYTSDNGSYMFRRDDPASKDHIEDPTVQAYRPDHHRSNHIFRGTKADIWEAGHRVPFFVRWPGHVRAGSTNATSICLVDLFATFSEVIGQPLPDNAAPDSYSFAPLLSGKAITRPRPPVIHHSASGMFAIRDGKWKLILGNGSGGRQAPRGRPFQKPFFLVDLQVDPTESRNLIEDHPDVAARLESACQQLRRGPLPR